MDANEIVNDQNLKREDSLNTMSKEAKDAFYAEIENYSSITPSSEQITQETEKRDSGDKKYETGLSYKLPEQNDKVLSINYSELQYEEQLMDRDAGIIELKGLPSGDTIRHWRDHKGFYFYNTYGPFREQSRHYYPGTAKELRFGYTTHDLNKVRSDLIDTTQGLKRGLYLQW